MSNDIDPRIAFAGVSTGLRTLTATAVTLANGESAWTGLATTLAAGEMIGDKLPATPARIAPIGLGGRAAFAALCGSMLARRHGRGEVGGASIAVLAAVGSAFAAYWLRKTIVSRLGIADPIVAVGEDAIAYGLARLANA